MNLFNKALFAVVVVISGTAFAACRSCKRAPRTTAVAMQKVIRSGRSMSTPAVKGARRSAIAMRSAIRSGRTMTKRTNMQVRTTRKQTVASGKSTVNSLGAYSHARKGAVCKNGVCSR